MKILNLPVYDSGIMLVESDPQHIEKIARSVLSVLKRVSLIRHVTDIGRLETAVALSSFTRLIIIRKEMFIFEKQDVTHVLSDLEEVFGFSDSPPKVFLISDYIPWDNGARNSFDRYSGDVTILKSEELDFALAQFLIEDSKLLPTTRSS